MKSCDTCNYFVRIRNLKNWQGRIGICEYEDGTLSKVIKKCKNYKSKKYVRPKHSVQHGQPAIAVQGEMEL